MTDVGDGDAHAYVVGLFGVAGHPSTTPTSSSATLFAPFLRSGPGFGCGSAVVRPTTMPTRELHEQG